MALLIPITKQEIQIIEEQYSLFIATQGNVYCTDCWVKISAKSEMAIRLAATAVFLCKFFYFNFNICDEFKASNPLSLE